MLVNKIRNTIKRYGMLSQKDKILVSVSGGPDSVALLYLLYTLRNEFNISIHIAHLDHMFRGEVSRKDMAYVARLAQRLELPLSKKRIDVPQEVKRSGLSEEDAARRIRYRFFLDVAKEVKANKIATGHTKDDQAETILMRIMRGAGLCGIRGIPPLQKREGVVIIRPLIEADREEIEEYLRAKRLTPRIDATNLNTRYLRNQIRWKLIPYLERHYNPDVQTALSNLGEIANVDYNYITSQGERLFSKLVRVRKGEVIVDYKGLTLLHPAIVREVLRQAVEVLRGDASGINYLNWKELYLIATTRPTGSSLEMLDVKVRKEHDGLIFRLKSPPSASNEEYMIEIPGKKRIKELGIEVRARVIRGNRLSL